MSFRVFKLAHATKNIIKNTKELVSCVQIAECYAGQNFFSYLASKWWLNGELKASYSAHLGWPLNWEGLHSYLPPLSKKKKQIQHRKFSPDLQKNISIFPICLKFCDSFRCIKSQTVATSSQINSAEAYHACNCLCYCCPFANFLTLSLSLSLSFCWHIMLGL